MYALVLSTALLLGASRTAFAAECPRVTDMDTLMVPSFRGDSGKTTITAHVAAASASGATTYYDAPCAWTYAAPPADYTLVYGKSFIAEAYTAVKGSTTLLYKYACTIDPARSTGDCAQTQSIVGGPSTATHYSFHDLVPLHMAIVAMETPTTGGPPPHGGNSTMTTSKKSTTTKPKSTTVTTTKKTAACSGETTLTQCTETKTETTTKPKSSGTGAATGQVTTTTSDGGAAAPTQRSHMGASAAGAAGLLLGVMFL